MNPLQMLSRTWWNLRRFGLTPDKWRSRLISRTESRVACVSIPKAGTHLIERALCLHPALYRAFVRTLYTRQVDAMGGIRPVLKGLQAGEVLLLHLKHSDRDERAFRDEDVRCVFQYRDPRDIVVSQAHFVTKRKDHPLHTAFAGLPDLKERISVAIQGDPSIGLESIGDRYRRFAGWLDADCLKVRFEDLVGPRGGGESFEQKKLLKSLYDELEVEASEIEIENLSAKIFSTASPTFRKGGRGNWRDLFDRELKALFKDVAGEELIRYGYEEGTDW